VLKTQICVTRPLCVNIFCYLCQTHVRLYVSDRSLILVTVTFEPKLIYTETLSKIHTLTISDQRASTPSDTCYSTCAVGPGRFVAVGGEPASIPEQYIWDL